MKAALTRQPSRHVGDAPWAAKGLVALGIIAAITWLVLGGDPWRALGGLVVSAGVALGILFGYRAAWVIAVVLFALGAIGTIGFIGELVTGDGLRPEDWSSLFFYALSALLLFHPRTRAWATR